MLTSRRWAAIDEALGIPLALTPVAGGVASVAPVVLRRRFGLTSAEATERSVKALADAFLVTPDAVTTMPGPHLTLDLDHATSWLAQFRIEATALTRRAEDARNSRPSVQLEGHRLPWDAFVHDVGLDAASWAVLLSASATAPFTVGPSLDALAGRTDANPLAMVRRAHAALTVRLDQTPAAPRGATASPSHSTPESAALRTHLALADRASFDALRTGRSRPLASAVGRVADAVCRYLEATPVTRTHLPLSVAARRVLADALAGASLTAPVPY